MKHTVELIDTESREVSAYEVETEEAEDFMVAVENLRDEQGEKDGTTYLVHNILRGGLNG